MQRDSTTEERRLSGEIPSLPKIDTRRMSLDVNFKFLKPIPVGIGRVLETIRGEGSEEQEMKDLEYERRVRATPYPCTCILTKTITQTMNQS